MDIIVIAREFPPHVIGGMGYHLGYLYSEIQDMGHDVTVLAGVCKQSRETAHHLQHDNIDVRTISYGSFHGHHLRFSVAVYRHLQEFDLTKYDVALTHTHIPFSLPIPTIQKYHDCSREERPISRANQTLIKKVADTLIDPTRKWIEQRSLYHLSHAIFNSNLCRNAWQRHYEVEPDTSVIHNGVNTDTFYPRNVDFDTEYVIFVGGSERKGLSNVIEFAEKTELEVYLVGSSQVQSRNVRCTGHVDQEHLAELYSGAVATIHPAQFEAFGNVILESLACGTPVVASVKCGASEIISEDIGYIGTDISIGIQHCRSLKQEDCVKTAHKHTWDCVADDTVSTVQRILYSNS